MDEQNINVVSLNNEIYGKQYYVKQLSFRALFYLKNVLLNALFANISYSCLVTHMLTLITVKFLPVKLVTDLSGISVGFRVKNKFSVCGRHLRFS